MQPQFTATDVTLCASLLPKFLM